MVDSVCPERLVGSRFVLSGNHADILLAMLPLIVHIRKKADQAALRWSVERMMQELCEPQAGGVLGSRCVSPKE